MARAPTASMRRAVVVGLLCMASALERRRKIAVVGSANFDTTYAVGAKLPTAGETVVTGGAPATCCGGKGLNQAVAAARVGDVAVEFAARVGDDAAAAAVRSALAAAGVGAARVAATAAAGTGLGVVLLLTAQRHFTYCASHAVTTLVHTQPSPAFASAPPPSPPAPCARRRASRYVLQRERLPLGLPGSSGEPLHLTFATASVDELLTNWVAHVRRLRLPAVVAAMDTTVVGRCGGLRVHCLPCLDEAAEALLAAEAAKHGQRDATQVNIRGNPTLFISLGARKVGALLLLLTVSGRPVLCSDVDVVWMRDPSPLVAGKMKGFEDLAHADVLASCSVSPGDVSHSLSTLSTMSSLRASIAIPITDWCAERAREESIMRSTSSIRRASMGTSASAASPPSTRACASLRATKPAQ